MSCCSLSSTGLNNIDANELTSDNITVFSNLNISGYSFLNNVLIKNNTTLLSSLNISGLNTSFRGRNREKTSPTRLC